MVYNWKVEKLFPVDAQVAGEYLTNLENEKGSLKPKDIVDVSRPEDAVLHNCFEWDNDIAAERYRDQQARRLMGNIVIVQQTLEKQPKDIVVRAFVNVPEPESRYVSTMSAFSDADMRSQVLRRAYEELLSFRQKYSNLTELSALFKMIDSIIVG